MTNQAALPGLEMPGDSTGYPGAFGQGPAESETRAAIAEIEAEHPITGARRTIKQLCISLAASIDKGNAKGRAIANEAAQLFTMMRELQPPEAVEASDDNLPPELRKLINAFESAAQLDPAPEGHAEGP